MIFHKRQNVQEDLVSRPQSLPISSFESDLEHALAKASRRSLSTAFRWVFSKLKWIVLLTLIIVLLYINNGPQISHYQGDLGTLAHGVSQLSAIFQKANKLTTTALAGAQIEEWEKKSPRPWLGIDPVCIVSAFTSCRLRTITHGETTVEYLSGGSPDQQQLNSESFVSSMRMLLDLERFMKALAGISTSGNTHELLGNVLAFQTALNAIIQSQFKGPLVSVDAIKEIDLMTLPSVQAIPWLPDVLYAFLGQVRLHVLRDSVHGTQPLVKDMSLVLVGEAQLIEGNLQAIYTDEATHITDETKIQSSRESYREAAGKAQAIVERLNTLQEAGLGKAARTFGLAYESVDKALQGTSSEAAAHAAIIDFANAVQKAEAVLTISDNVREQGRRAE